jgi:hypothetical protein
MKLAPMVIKMHRHPVEKITARTFRQSDKNFTAAYNPQHIKASQSINTHESLTDNRLRIHSDVPFK